MDFLDILQTVTVGGVSLGGIVFAVVSTLKYFGLPTKYAPVANGVTAVAFVSAVTLLDLYPDYTKVFEFVCMTVVVFASASGVHQFSKTKGVE